MIIATMIPISVSGLGLREGASLLLLGGYGIAAEQIVAFSLLVFTVSVVFVGLLGGFLEVRRLWSGSSSCREEEAGAQDGIAKTERPK